MKKIILIGLSICAFGFTNAQDFKGHASGTIGILNAKIRLQYELPLGGKYSTGANLNYYTVNWQGPIIEPFLRLYAGGSNESGGFFQAKAGYGNLTTLPYMNTTAKRWSTYGGGVAWGYKYVRPSGFTIEPLIGVRLYSAPNENIDLNSSNGAEQLGEDIGWALTTGFPIDFQLKFGYQF
jgi:hypothetical protein